MVRQTTDRAILIAGWLWFLVYAYPGYISYDSAVQLAQARQLEPMSDWHPPMMALIWRVTDTLIAGPFPMLVIQSVAFLLGINALLRHVMSRRAAAIVAVVLLVAPPNIILMAAIWKDAQMAGFLFAGIAALFSTNRRWRIAGYVLIFFATAVRYNAAAAAFPVVVLQFGWQGTLPRWRRYLTGIAVWLGITIAAFAANALLVERHVGVWESGAAPLDIAGVIRYAPDLDHDELLRDTAGVPWASTENLQDRVRTFYRPNANFGTITQEPGKLFNPPTTDAERDAIAAAWKNLVWAHPLAFLQHRLSVFGAELKFNGGGPHLVFADVTDPVYDERLQHREIHSAVQQRWIAAMRWFGGTLMYQVSLYFVLSLAFLPMCRGNRRAAVVLASGLAHMLSLFALAPAVDYRYAHWMIMCTFVGGILVFATRLKTRPAGAT